MSSKPRDTRRMGFIQAMYALTVIVSIPAIMLIEVAPRREVPPLYRQRMLPPLERPFPYGPNMDVPAHILPPLEVKPLKR